MACLSVEQTLGAPTTAHVRGLQERVKSSGRTWEGSILGSTFKESSDLLVPSEFVGGTRTAMFGRRAAYHAAFIDNELPEVVRKGISSDCRALAKGSRFVNLLPVDVRDMHLRSKDAAPSVINEHLESGPSRMQVRIGKNASSSCRKVGASQNQIPTLQHPLVRNRNDDAFAACLQKIVTVVHSELEVYSGALSIAWRRRVCATTFD